MSLSTRPERRRSRGARSRRTDGGFSLLEVIASLALFAVALAVMAQLAHAALSWRDTESRVVSVATSDERIRAHVRSALEAGVPVDALSETASGCEEGRKPGATRTWSAPANLIVRAAEGWLVIDRAGGRLVARRFRKGAKEETLVLASAVTASAFTVVNDAKGRPAGVAYKVSVAASARPIDGFVALRAEGGAP